MLRIGVIGTGTIAAAVIHGIAGDGHQITVSERSAEKSAELAAAFDNVSIAGNQAVLDTSDVVLVALMAEVAPEVLGLLRFRPDQQVISLMAGPTLDDLAKMVSPARAAALMVPFPAIAKGGSPVIAQGDADLVRQIVTPRNEVFVLEDPAQMQAYFCAQAILSPVAQMVGEAGRWLSSRVTDPEQGEAFLRALVASSLAEMRSDDLVAALNTEGGYNQRLRLHMEAQGLSDSLRTGLDRLEAGS